MVLFRILLTVSIFVVSSTVFAAGAAKATGSKQLLSASVMALSSSTKQGGEGPSGSTVLSHSEYVYAWPNFGVGMFFQYDMQGTTEKDSTYGPKVETYLDPFYLELGYAISAKRAYTDRTIADQTGDGIYYGLGARFSLGAGKGPSGGWFFQASYKFRTLTIKKQDNIAIDEPIQQTDGYPLIGLGLQF
ncbi:hypothetical protein [Bdellovibrio sp. HCB337]|uniref:hypothetical protein n=1 Tax=Bdellovibrio sp. HCB337 TaxID=3394358 RepID=UPI0039A6E653